MLTHFASLSMDWPIVLLDQSAYEFKATLECSGMKWIPYLTLPYLTSIQLIPELWEIVENDRLAWFERHLQLNVLVYSLPPSYSRPVCSLRIDSTFILFYLKDKKTKSNKVIKYTDWSLANEQTPMKTGRIPNKIFSGVLVKF